VDDGEEADHLAVPDRHQPGGGPDGLGALPLPVPVAEVVEEAADHLETRGSVGRLQRPDGNAGPGRHGPGLE
jgi:hypothetical protein